MSFFSINIFKILNLLGKMPPKFEFIGKVHKKIQTNKRKRTLTRCKANNKIQNKQKNIERVQNKTRIFLKMILK